MIAGIGGLITATVMACKASTKAEDILEETQEDLYKVHSITEAKKEEGTYKEEETRKVIFGIYAKTAYRFAKLYGPSVIVGAVSIGAIMQSHGIMKKRNMALASAYSTLDQSFKKYKKRVAERFGEDAEKDVRYDTSSLDVEKITVDEKGKEKKTKETIHIAGYDVSPYAKFFDESCPNWTKDAEQNLMFLRQLENWANDRLFHRGYLTLNEVYESIGIPPTSQGMVIGWLYKPGNNRYANCVDFGIYNVHRQSNRDFVNGYERSILLDFNPDGYIYGKLEGETDE